MLRYLPGIHRIAGVLLAASLAACSGGGGDEDDAVDVSVSSSAISFRAAAADTTTPAAQIVTATFGENIAHVAVIHSGDAIASVSSVTNGKTAQISITPAAPTSMGAGAFSGAVAITGYTCADPTCSRLAAGNTQTVTVGYQVSPVIQRAAPYVAIAGVSDTVTVRGLGFLGFAIQGVRFGTIPATTFATPTNTSVNVTYPALAAGTYQVQFDASSHDGAIPSTATLVVVDAATYAATTLAYPAASTAVRALVFDAERRALLVATDAGGGSIFRYPYSGSAWGTPTSGSIANLQDIALSGNGSQVLALTTTSVIPVEPAGLTTGAAVDAPSLPTDSFLKNLAVANDDRAIITTGINSSTVTVGYVYTISSAVLQQSGLNLNNATPGAPADGGRVVLIQGHPSLTADPGVFVYGADSGSFVASTVVANQNSIAPALDRTASRLVLKGLTVYDSAFSPLGALPASTAAVVLRPDGRRAYTYDATANVVRRFDITADLDGAAYTELGSGVALPGNPGSGVKMAISPDGNGLFLAGSSQLVVLPTPPDT